MKEIAILFGISNATRGTGKFNDHVILGKIFDKVFLSIFILGYFIYEYNQAYDWLFSVIYAVISAFPILFIYMVGTGGLHQAFNDSPDNVNIEEFGPFDILARILSGTRLKVNPRIVTVARSNKWGIWYATLCGIVFSIPFLYSQSLTGILMIFLGLYLRSLKIVKWNYKWNFFYEFIWNSIYIYFIANSFI